MKPFRERLQYVPIALFAVVMGLAGLTIAWEKAGEVFGVPVAIGSILAGVTSLAFVAVAALYGLKLATHPGAVRADLQHPVRLNFFPTISISLILLSIILLPLIPWLARPFWIAGSALHLGLLLYVLNAWMHHEHFEIKHMNPAWFIPAVGNVLVPISGVPLGFVEISWFFFSVGIVFWIILFTIIIYRMLFHNPMEARLMPTLFILIAPPAVGFLAYQRLVGELDTLARILFFTALFLTLLLLTQIKHFLRLPFFISWWAYTFPIAAITVATMVMHQLNPTALYPIFAAVLLAALTLLVGWLLVRTIRGLVLGHLLAPEGG